MELKYVQDVNAPVEYVFEQVSDFAKAVESAERAGVEVERIDDKATRDVGLEWRAVVNIRRRPREFMVKVTDMEHPKWYTLAIKSATIRSNTMVECLSMNADVTRLLITAEMEPANLRGRLLLQTLRLARGRIKSGGDKQLLKYAKKIEQDFRSVA